MKTLFDKFCEKLLTAKICGFDTMVFIYLFEANPKFFPLAEKTIKLLEEGKLKGITSIIAPLEILSVKTLEDKPEKRKEYFDFFRKEKNLQTIELSWDITELSARLRRQYQLKTPDAIQLATAKLTGARLFLTNDDNFRKIKELPTVFFKDFVE